MSTSRAKTISSWVLVILLAAGYLIGAVGKLTGAATQMFEGWGYAPWFALVIGAAEVGGSLLLLYPRLASYAAVLLIMIMIGAIGTVLTNETQAQGPPGLHTREKENRW